MTSAGASTVFLPTADEEARLRDLILAELDRQRAHPLARQTLALMVEAATEPTEEAPGYRVVDRHGAPRMRPVPAPDSSQEKKSRKKAGPAPAVPAEPVPFTLEDLVAELRARHPALFAPIPEPAPEPVEPPRDPLAEVKAASARFVETQSALARSFANRSAERGRAIASAASGVFEGWRARRDHRLPPSPPYPVPSPAEGAPPVAPDAAAQGLEGPPPFSPPPQGDRPGLGAAGLTRLRRLGADAGDRLREGRHRLLDRAQGFGWRDQGDGARRSRTLLAGFAGLTALAVVAAVLVSGGDEEEATAPKPQASTEGPRPAKAPEAPAQPPSQAPAQAKPPAQAKAPPADTEEQPAEGEEPPAPPRNPNELRGPAEVIDTATLRVAGKVVHLFGVEWVRGGQAEELTKYLAGREVTCLPAPGSSAHTCTVESRDLSEVVLFNGGGRASSEATPELIAAEDHARSERLGVWKR